jgi:endonuclease/exonuclease/phosphatase family metal-dependent hydrolase
LAWNLYHGRSPRPAGKSLLHEFATALAGWEWDVALLQEVPPWWPAPLAAATGAEPRIVLTSRNLGLPLRRAISSRNPDILKANGGGSNLILVRGPVLEHRTQRLTWWPERRWVHGVRLVDGSWAVNLHASTHVEAHALSDSLRALDAARKWAGGAPLLFGGDLNLHGHPELPGLLRVASNHVDHLYTEGRPAREVEVLDRGRLSDHAPVRVSF